VSRSPVACVRFDFVLLGALLRERRSLRDCRLVVPHPLATWIRQTHARPHNQSPGDRRVFAMQLFLHSKTRTRRTSMRANSFPRYSASGRNVARGRNEQPHRRRPRRAAQRLYLRPHANEIRIGEQSCAARAMRYKIDGKFPSRWRSCDPNDSRALAFLLPSLSAPLLAVELHVSPPRQPDFGELMRQFRYGRPLARCLWSASAPSPLPRYESHFALTKVLHKADSSSVEP